MWRPNSETLRRGRDVVLGKDPFGSVNGHPWESSETCWVSHVEEGFPLCGSETGTALPGHAVASLCLHITQVASGEAECPASGTTECFIFRDRAAVRQQGIQVSSAMTQFEPIITIFGLGFQYLGHKLGSEVKDQPQSSWNLESLKQVPALKPKNGMTILNSVTEIQAQNHLFQ